MYCVYIYVYTYVSISSILQHISYILPIFFSMHVLYFSKHFKILTTRHNY